ncbi:MAG TPA: CoA transferase, partial [Acidimicrobiales bacterium]
MGADPMFAGLRVVELAGDPAGEAVGRTFAQLGADVVKVEPPSGSPTRAVGPFAHGREDGDHSLTFWYQNRNKRSVVVDHTTAEGRATVLRLAAGADVVVTTLAPAEAEATGLTVDALAAASGRLVVVSVTPFGLTGPWSGWASSDLVGLALGSPLHSCGYDDHTIPPIRP